MLPIRQKFFQFFSEKIRILQILPITTIFKVVVVVVGMCLTVLNYAQMA